MEFHKGLEGCKLYVYKTNKNCMMYNATYLIHDIININKYKIILLMEEILQQLIGNSSHYLQGLKNPRWLAGFLPSTVLYSFQS